jgi:hypothetical protein
MVFISSSQSFVHDIPHLLSRANLYDDVIALYTSSKAVLKEYPFRVRFSGEEAFDIGGVARDLFSGFFEAAYSKLFDGPSLLVPNDFPDVSASPLATFGSIVSHAYLVAGVLPVKISFPCLLLQNPVSIPDEVLVKSFVDCLNCYEAGIVNRAVTIVQSDNTDTFPADIQDGLLDIYSRFSIREVPKPGNFLLLVLNMAKFHFFRRPAASISDMKSGIPELHLQFWNKMSVSEFYELYKALQVSPMKVLALLDGVNVANQAEERVFGYLRQYIGNSKGDDLGNSCVS